METETKISTLEKRMEHVDAMLSDIRQKVDNIERGLFGNPEFGHTGMADRISKLEKEVNEIKRVNDNQEISINARKNITDEAVVWLQRAFWGGAVLLVLMLLLTGKIGFLDLVRGLMD